ncbi:hypothetical protein [Methylobacterium sp. 77]|uniref:hypothetical protein n=1 Tax=Methylobacterium sp. 77 TaxID=1101192 RepID=UPI00037F22F6|nr:hypothetical protein [Methylobacterium sp. 77]
MDRIVIRIVKPITFALIAFISSYYLFGSLFISGVLSLIPLLLGWVGVLEAFSYTIAALIFIAAVVWAVVPVETKNFVRQQSDAFTNELTAAVPETKKPD